MENTKHLWRAAILLILFGSAVVVGRHFLVPSSFGEMGYFRGDALYEFMEKAPEHGGAAACAECHDDVAAERSAGAHAVVQCEVCHEDLASHVRDGDKHADMAVNRSFKLCATCHQYQVARPSSMPQVVLTEHLELQPGDPVPGEACLECHDPHNP